MLEGFRIRLPVGVRDFLPRAAARRRAIAEALLAEFERWGYERIITPAFEYADVLARGLGEGARAAALRFVEPATGDIVALRPDITPQVARVAATRLGGVAGPLRLSYEGSVLRLVSSARGQRELIQTGVELIDAPALAGDAEAIALAGASLRAAGLEDATIDVGHVALVKEILGLVPDEALRAELSARIAKKDRDGVARAAKGGGLPPKVRRLLEALPSLYGEPRAVLSRARALTLPKPAMRALDELERALDAAASLGVSQPVTMDLGETRGFDYYTGLRLAGYAPGVGEAVLRGGRYDHLLARYGRPAAAIGFAVDVEIIADAERADGAPEAGPRGVLVVDRGSLGERPARVARALRESGWRAAVDLAPARDDEKLVAYAAEVGMRWVLLLEGRRVRVLDVVDGGARPLAQELIVAAVRGDGRSLVRALEAPRGARAPRRTEG